MSAHSEVDPPELRILATGKNMAYAQEKKPLRLVVKIEGQGERKTCAQCEVLQRMELLRLQLRKALVLATPPAAGINPEELR